MFWYVWSRLLKVLPAEFGRKLVVGTSFGGEPVERELIQRLVKKAESVRQLRADLWCLEMLNMDAKADPRTRQIRSLQKTVWLWEKQLRELVCSCERTRVPAWKVYLVSRS